MNSVKPVKLNSGQAIQDFVHAISAHAALPEAAVSLPAQASFFLFYVGDNTGAGYCPSIMPRPAG